MSLTKLGLTEGWLRHKIAEQPNALGLGAMITIMQEKRQKGRVDLLLEDDARDRYVVELQRGPLDASHLLRVLEYRRFEAAANPNQNHVAVLVAEGYDGDIGALSETLQREGMPLLRVKVTIAENSNPPEPIFSVAHPTEETDIWTTVATPANGIDRESDWRRHPCFPVMSELFTAMKEQDARLELNYLSFLGVKINGGTYNATAFHHWGRVQPSGFKLELKLPQSGEIDTELDRLGVTWRYQRHSTSRENYLVSVPKSPSHELLNSLKRHLRTSLEKWNDRSTRQA